jgi:hypothetical protein
VFCYCQERKNRKSKTKYLKIKALKIFECPCNVRSRVHTSVSGRPRGLRSPSEGLRVGRVGALPGGGVRQVPAHQVGRTPRPKSSVCSPSRFASSPPGLNPGVGLCCSLSSDLMSANRRPVTDHRQRIERGTAPDPCHPKPPRRGRSPRRRGRASARPCGLRDALYILALASR